MRFIGSSIPSSAFGAVVSLALAACGDGAAPASGVPADVASIEDASGLDATSEADETSEPDETSEADGTSEADETSGHDDARAEGDAVPASCGEAMDMTRFAARCDGRWILGSDFSYPDGGAECPTFVRLDGVDYPTRADALAGENCATDCVLNQSMSVSAVYCRADCETMQRYGWIAFASASAACPELYELPGGLFTSVDEWLAAQPDVCARGATACLEPPP